jgi:DNA helicase II / ATP-dependent DNA helicase PcrA
VGQDFLERLNAQQAAAVTLGWGPSLVVAGAGSGKTTVLTRRVAYIVRGLAQPASSVLAVTFTNKAAGEMKERLTAMLPEAFRQLTIGTFHSICARLLRHTIEGYRNADGYTWSRNFVIYDEDDSLSLVKGAVTRLNLDEKVFAPKDMRRAISTLKNDGYSCGEFAREARNYRDTRLAEIFAGYQESLSRNNALDFDDLIGIFTELLESNPEVQAAMQQRFRHILVDEFQDTNQAQYRLIRCLVGDTGQDAWEGRSLMVVGDVDQSIYAWRRADIRIIMGFQKDYPLTQVVTLEDNYRSTGTILAVANSIIQNNSERLEKVLRCNRSPGGKIRCYAASDEIDEAFFAAEELKRLQARGVKLADCALLYRTNAQSRALEEVMIRSGLPYTMVGAIRFYDRAEIKDVLAYLKLVYNHADGQSFMRTVNNPRRGLGKTTLDRLADFAGKQKITLVAAAVRAQEAGGISEKSTRTLASFAQALRRWQDLSADMPVSALLELILSESGYLKHLEEEAGKSRDETLYGRVENVRELVAVAREFEDISDQGDLETFLTRISLVSDLDAARFDQDAIRLMTIHSAKGLEFGSVFLMGLEEGLFPHVRSLDSPSALEEERRLMYVGVTRAADRLYLTYSNKRMIFSRGDSPGSNYTVPSRFLSEIDPEHLSGLQLDPDSMFRPGNRPTRQPPADELSGTFTAERFDQPTSHVRPGFRQLESNVVPITKIQAPTPPSRQRQDNQEVARTRSTRQPRSAAGANSASSQPVPAPSSSFVPHTASGPHQPSANWEKLSVGDNVMHSKFGVGSVVAVIGEAERELYNVDFQSAGKRLLDPRFAKLIKLD